MCGYYLSSSTLSSSSNQVLRPAITVSYLKSLFRPEKMRISYEKYKSGYGAYAVLSLGSSLHVGSSTPTSSAQAAIDSRPAVNTAPIEAGTQLSRVITTYTSAISDSFKIYLPKISIRNDPVVEAAPATYDPQNEPVHNGTVFNYYFLFLAAFVVLIGASLWWVHGRRRRRTQQLQASGQHALARDLEGWAGTQGSTHGIYGRYPPLIHAMRAEGLDEHGEAPPPYQSKNEVAVGATQAPEGAQVTIPRRTHARDEHHIILPPGYSVAIGA
jgi:hypothetical protein